MREQVAERPAREARLRVVVETARSCTRCPSMEGRARVLGPGNGSLDARCLLIAEAPGRFGANRTGIPLHGDRAGESFERLLAEAGLGREMFYVTNAVLCGPLAADGRGRRPRTSELAQCRAHLVSLLDCLDPVVVVTLGSTALAATDGIEQHGLSLRWDVGTAHRWRRRFLLPLYHPGPRSTIQRAWADQLRDFRGLAALLRV